MGGERVEERGGGWEGGGRGLKRGERRLNGNECWEWMEREGMLYAYTSSTVGVLT